MTSMAASCFPDNCFGFPKSSIVSIGDAIAVLPGFARELPGVVIHVIHLARWRDNDAARVRRVDDRPVQAHALAVSARPSAT